jgi:hypothetical protein
LLSGLHHSDPISVSVLTRNRKQGAQDFRDKNEIPTERENFPPSAEDSGLRSIHVYSSEDRKMLDKQTAVLAETKQLSKNVETGCDMQWRVT